MLPENSTVSLEFSIEDTGHGIAPNKIQQILKSSLKAKENKKTYCCYRLGLSIVKKLPT
jgi:signal transduction histidine kinase